jgi:hypothetical protein
MSTPFDPEQNYGEVIPPMNGACFYQNGRHFNNHHDEVDPRNGDILAKAPAKAPSEPKAKKVATRPRASEVVEDEEEATPEPAGDDDAVDLTAWAKGLVKDVGFFKIKALIAKEFGKTPANAKEAREIILDE